MDKKTKSEFDQFYKLAMELSEIHQELDDSSSLEISYDDKNKLLSAIYLTLRSNDRKAVEGILLIHKVSEEFESKYGNDVFSEDFKDFLNDEGVADWMNDVVSKLNLKQDLSPYDKKAIEILKDNLAALLSEDEGILINDSLISEY